VLFNASGALALPSAAAPTIWVFGIGAGLAAAAVILRISLVAVALANFMTITLLARPEQWLP